MPTQIFFPVQHSRLELPCLPADCPGSLLRVSQAPLPRGCKKSNGRRQAREQLMAQGRCAVANAHTISLYSRREALVAGVTTAWLTCSRQSAAAVLKSKNSDRPGVLTLRNDLEAAARVYWLNFDGSAPYFLSHKRACSATLPCRLHTAGRA